MKKFLLCTMLLGFAASPLFALRPGDKALKLDRIRMVRGDAVDPAVVVEKSQPPALRAVVFLLCRAENAPATVAMLNDLERSFGGELRTMVVTPDPTPDAETLKSVTGAFRVPIGVDVERQITKQYMAGSLLYPMAFLVGRDGVILWCGEAVDLAEKIRPALDGKLSIDTEAKIAEAVAELQQLLRDNSEVQMRRVVKRIFSLEPGNAAALRIRLFTLENTRRIPEAGQLISEQLKAAPKLPRLYFTAADFAARYNASDAELAQLVAAFDRNITDPATRIRMAWMLLERFPYHPAGLRFASGVLRRPLPPEPLPRANAAAARALLEYRVGDVAKALEYQREAVRLLNQVGSEAELASAKQREAYLRAVLDLK